MNYAISYQESFHKPAAAMALLVHVLFFCFLYFNFSLKAPEQTPIAVELWSSIPTPSPASRPVVKSEPLPEPTSAPEPEPEPAPLPEPVKEIPPPITEPLPELPPVKQPDIVLKVKPEPKKEPEPKKDPEKPKEPEPVKKAEPPKKPIEWGSSASEQMKPKVNPFTSASAASASQTNVQSAQAVTASAAPNQRIVNDYRAKIAGLVRSNTIMPPDVDSNIKIRFKFYLTTGGYLKGEPVLLQQSGNPQYDRAVEVAIKKSEPFPLPDDIESKKALLELDLTWSP